MRMQAGEIVWTRVVFPQKWWPGLVLRADALGVLVSFFDLQPPRYFFDSQVRPFEDNFRSLSCSTSDALLERALRLFGRRTLWSLTCPCRRGKKNSRGCFQAAAAAATSFQAVGVLGFILSRAVSPWIEEADFVDAVRVLAQIQAFRGYSSGNQRLRYKRYDQRGSEDENSVAHETDNLEVQGESQLFFMEVENNLAAGVTKIANSGLSVVKGSFDERDHDSMSQARIKQWKADAANEMLVNLHCLAVDPCYLVGKHLKTLEQNVLRSRRLSFQNTPDFCLRKFLQPKSIEAQSSHRLDIYSPTQIKHPKVQSVDEMLINLCSLALDPCCLAGKCLKTLEQNILKFRSLSFQNTLAKCSQPKGIEAQFSHPEFTKPEMRVKVDRKQRCVENVSSSVSCTDTSVNCLGRKRELQQPSASFRSFKVHKTMPFFSGTGTSASLHINKTGGKANSLDASISAPLSGPSFKLQVAMSAFQLNGSGAYLKRKHNGFEIDRFNAPFPISPIKLKIKHHSASGPQSFTYLCNSSFVELVLDMFSISPSEEASHHGDNVEICKLQEPAKNVDINTKPCISCVERQELGKCVCNWENNGVQDEDVGVDSNLRSLQPLATQSVSNHVIGTHAKSTEVDSGLAAKSGLIADIIKKLPGDGAIFNRSNECASINLALGDSFNEHKELYRPVISNSSFGSQRGRQLEALAASTSLHMKFPRLFKLPSKEELVKVFCPFGPVDTLKTRISSWTGAAQVVFSHPNDAVAAYQYAKEKITLFGKANIRFWLDPLEHRRRGTKNSVPSPSMTGKSVNQKSCRSVSSTSSIKSQRGEKWEATTSATASTLHMKFPKDFKLPSKEELLKKFCPFHTVDSQRTKVFFNTGAAQVVFSDPTDAVAAYQYAKKKVLFGDTNIRFWLDPLEHKRRGTMFSAPSPSITGKPVNRKLCPPVSSTSSFKSQGGEQLEELAPGTAFTALHMKFSNNSKPPSKQELIKKFSPFGTIDSTKTKVFSCTGAAQVVFLNPTDAVAAYQYAKKKRVLSSEANVRFWVDALEHRKRGTKVPVSPRELTGKPVNLKSCLKKSSPPEHRDQKKPYNVRFIIQA
ncbi:uncharacterized protein LOC122292814 [Carya illinoinensis]|uniref:PWWP domain-containing protein n=2 Tax=Carya illinoinensis TaxID=32201 RepID=A0A922AE72_CARIL|nr:uncharacterized protein LOC122292814 [Carya illinoinensis]KAG6680018.1 hypothetical protein I3842_13G018500 [Carya illinoinensis]